MKTWTKRSGPKGQPEGSDKDVNKETGTGRQGKISPAGISQWKKGWQLVMVNMTGEKVVGNEPCL